jgi:hypothetical protein
VKSLPSITPVTPPEALMLAPSWNVLPRTTTSAGPFSTMIAFTPLMALPSMVPDTGEDEEIPMVWWTRWLSSKLD